MNNKYVKPDLVDPILYHKVAKTLKLPVDDYWKPTKNVCKSFYQNWIRPNYLLIALFVLIAILLLYRYRIVQDRKLNNPRPPKKSAIESYADLVLGAYNQQKEYLREPQNNQWIQPNLAVPKQTDIVYPMYPSKGGSLEPAAKR